MGMLEQLIITLREGVEAALIVAIALAYLRRIGRQDLNRTVYAALVAAVAVSLAGAIVLSAAHGNVDRYEGWLMLIAAVFVVSMVVWMHRSARFLRQGIESRLAGLQSTRGGGRAWGLFLFIFLMVLREGMETVLMLSAVSLNSSELLAWIGSVLGLLLAAAFAVAFVRGSVRVNLPRFFKITTAILVVIAAQLLISSVHELMEAGTLPSSPSEMGWVGPIVANEVFFFIIILGLAGLMILRERRPAAAAAGAAADASGAVRRRAVAEARSERRWSTLAYTGAFLILVLIAGDYVYARAAQSLSPAEVLTPVAGWVHLPAAQVADGALHRYQVVTPAGTTRFFAIRRPDGSIAVALDACEVCGAYGYYQHAGQLFCLHCNAPVNAAMVGMSGGCNPVPLAVERQGDLILIHLTLLAQNAAMFH